MIDEKAGSGGGGRVDDGVPATRRISRNVRALVESVPGNAESAGACVVRIMMAVSGTACSLVCRLNRSWTGNKRDRLLCLEHNPLGAVHLA